MPAILFGCRQFLVIVRENEEDDIGTSRMLTQIALWLIVSNVYCWIDCVLFAQLVKTTVMDLADVVSIDFQRWHKLEVLYR